jgi:excisionase family DNA binding protein
MHHEKRLCPQCPQLPDHLYCLPRRDDMEKDLEPVRLLTLRQTAEALNLSRQTLRLLRRNKLPGVKVAGQWRIRESDLTKFIHDLDSRSCNPLSVTTNCGVNLCADQKKSHRPLAV